MIGAPSILPERTSARNRGRGSDLPRGVSSLWAGQALWQAHPGGDDQPLPARGGKGGSWLEIVQTLPIAPPIAERSVEIRRKWPYFWSWLPDIISGCHRFDPCRAHHSFNGLCRRSLIFTPRDGLPHASRLRFSARSARRGDAGHREPRAPLVQGLGPPPQGPKAPVHKTRGSRRSGRAGEPAVASLASPGRASGSLGDAPQRPRQMTSTHEPVRRLQRQDRCHQAKGIGISGRPVLLPQYQNRFPRPSAKNQKKSPAGAGLVILGW